MAIRRYLKTAFYGEQAFALLRRIISARQAAARRGHGEALHDWRVLVRRLIEFTRLWAPRTLRKQVLPIAEPWIDASNAARDAEVERGMTGVLREESGPHWSAQLERLEQAAQALFEKEYAALEAHLADPARQDEERRLEELLDGLPRFPLTPLRLPRRLKKAIDRFTDLVEDPAVRHDGNLKEMHKLRLAIKRLRYGLEPLEPLDDSLKPVLAELTAMQRALGENRDWQRLIEKWCNEKVDAGLINAMQKHAEKALAERPARLKETEAWIKAGWQAPRPVTRTLRRRLVKELPEGARGPVGDALTMASKTRKNHKREDGSAALLRPLRAALSLLEEAGLRESRAITAAVLSQALSNCPTVSEDSLAEKFGNQIVGAALALALEEETPEERRQHLEVAPAWIRTVGLALELEELRYWAETEKRSRAARHAQEQINPLRPAFNGLRTPPAKRLLERLDNLMKILKK